MKTTKVIETVFGSPGRIAVLRRLASAPQPLSGRQVAELTGLTHRGAIQAMDVLVEAGAVRQRQVGRSYQYTMVRDNVIVKKIILPALDAEEQLLELMQRELLKKFSADAISLILFGSYARGEESWKSDVDVLAITATSAKKEKVERTAEAVSGKFREQFGSQLSVHALTLRELKAKSHAPFFKEAKTEGILLSGRSLDELSKKHA